MNDTFRRQKFKYYRHGDKFRKMNSKNHMSYIKLMQWQLILATLLCIIFLSVKFINYPLANTITDKIKYSLTVDINYKYIFNNVTNFITKVDINRLLDKIANKTDKNNSNDNTRIIPTNAGIAANDSSDPKNSGSSMQTSAPTIPTNTGLAANDSSVSKNSGSSMQISAPTIDDAAFYSDDAVNGIPTKNKSNNNNPSYARIDSAARGGFTSNSDAVTARIGGASSFPLNPNIIIDPGHGGDDPGAIKDGIIEKEVTLDISKRLQAYLKLKKYIVILTRNSDTSVSKLSLKDGYTEKEDLNARVNMINNSKAEFFLCIHADSNPDDRLSGSVVYYNEYSPVSKILAENIQKNLNRIMINGKQRSANKSLPETFYVLRNSKIPGVLVETAYITNKQEHTLLGQNSFRDKLANAIYKGVIDSGY